jgi:hypothetical protein
MPTFVAFKAIRSNAKVIPGPAIMAALDEYTFAFCADIITETSPYPDGVDSWYVRTGRLLGNWRIRREGLAEYRVVNGVQDKWGRYYAGYVHGPNQASFHAAHGWENIKDHIDRAKFRTGAQAVINAGVRF